MIPRRRLPIRLHDLSALAGTGGRSDRAQEHVPRFERAFADYLGCAFARATASGRDALLLALDAVGLVSGDEIIVPAYTLGELLPLLRARGLVPVAADIEPDTFNVDVGSVQQQIGPRTRAILATHLLGAPCSIQEICALAEEHGLAVIEDCAHALGASVAGRKVGTFGRAALFSLEVNKALPTYGGGVLVSNDPGVAAFAAAVLDARPVSGRPAIRKAVLTWLEEIAIRSPFYGLLAKLLFSERAAGRFERLYRGSHDRARKEVVAYSGFQARLGLRRMDELDARNRRLNVVWEEMSALLPQRFTPQVRGRVGQPAFYNLVVTFDGDATVLRRAAARLGVDLGVRGEVMDDCATLLGAKDCPVAAEVYRRAVLVPCYDGLSQRRQSRVVAVLQQLAEQLS